METVNKFPHTTHLYCSLFSIVASVGIFQPIRVRLKIENCIWPAQDACEALQTT